MNQYRTPLLLAASLSSFLLLSGMSPRSWFQPDYPPPISKAPAEAAAELEELLKSDLEASQKGDANECEVKPVALHDYWNAAIATQCQGRSGLWIEGEDGWYQFRVSPHFQILDTRNEIGWRDIAVREPFNLRSACCGTYTEYEGTGTGYRSTRKDSYIGTHMLSELVSYAREISRSARDSKTFRADPAIIQDLEVSAKLPYVRAGDNSSIIANYALYLWRIDNFNGLSGFKNKLIRRFDPPFWAPYDAELAMQDRDPLMAFLDAHRALEQSNLPSDLHARMKAIIRQTGERAAAAERKLLARAIGPAGEGNGFTLRMLPPPEGSPIPRVALLIDGRLRHITPMLLRTHGKYDMAPKFQEKNPFKLTEWLFFPIAEEGKPKKTLVGMVMYQRKSGQGKTVEQETIIPLVVEHRPWGLSPLRVSRKSSTILSLRFLNRPGQSTHHSSINVWKLHRVNNSELPDVHIISCRFSDDPDPKSRVSVLSQTNQYQSSTNTYFGDVQNLFQDHCPFGDTPPSTLQGFYPAGSIHENDPIWDLR